MNASYTGSASTYLTFAGLSAELSYDNASEVINHLNLPAVAMNKIGFSREQARRQRLPPDILTGCTIMFTRHRRLSSPRSTPS